MESKREVFVLEENGVPVRCNTAQIEASDSADRLVLAVEAGVRMGRPIGEERVVRYVPEHANLWLFQANENWTETQLTNTGPIQPILQQDVDGGPWTFSLYFIAPDWDAAKRLMDEMQGHRVGSYVEHTVPEPKTLKERTRRSKHRPHRWVYKNLSGVDSDLLKAEGAEVASIRVCKRCGQVRRSVRFPPKKGGLYHEVKSEWLAVVEDGVAKVVSSMVHGADWFRGDKACTQ